MKMKNKHPVLKTLFGSIRSSRLIFSAMVLMIIVSVLFSLFPPLVLEKGINLMTDGRSTGVVLAIFYLTLIVLADFAESLQNTAITVFGQRSMHGLRSEMTAKLSRLPEGYFSSHESGQVESIFVNDVNTISSLYSDGVVSMIADSFKLVGILVVIFTRSAGLGLLILLVLPFIFLLTRSFQKRTLASQKRNRAALGRINSQIPETVRNMRMIRVFHKEKFMEDRCDEYINESYRAARQSNIYDSIYSPIIILVQVAIIAVMMTGAAAGGSFFRSFFGMSVGSAVAVIAYVGQIFSPLESIGMEIQNIQAAAAGISRVADFLNKEEMNDGDAGKSRNEAVILPDGDEDAEIIFDRVSFSYVPGRPVLKNMSFRIRKGEHVTFTGRTGAGKTTLFRLILGLEQPDSGRVLLQGRPPSIMDDGARRDLTGSVEQEFHRVPGTVRDQVTLGNPDVTDDMVRSALDTAGLLHVIDSFSDGMDTVMDESLFSMGQLQLLSIARAVVFSPDILLLDEMTAALDSRTEEEVLAALDRAAEGRTVLSISHRMSRAVAGKQRIIEIGRGSCKSDNR